MAQGNIQGRSRVGGSPWFERQAVTKDADDADVAFVDDGYVIW